MTGGPSPASAATEGDVGQVDIAADATARAPVVVHDQVVPARAPWTHQLLAGEHLRIVDLHGNQAVDFLAYVVADPVERYSAPDTIAAAGNVFLTSGTVLMTNRGRPMLTVVDDTCGRPGTIGGACSRESNTVRYGHHTAHQHACVENFLLGGAPHGLGKRDLQSNVNWFMNVPVEPDGTLGIVDGISAPGKHVEVRAELDVIVVVSNCPQINNPCNGFDPTPVRMIVTRPS
jgi:hypothetical protein